MIDIVDKMSNEVAVITLKHIKYNIENARKKDDSIDIFGCDRKALDMAIKALEQQPSREWKEIYAESEGSNSWIEFKCPHCGCSFGMESGEYDWHYGDEIPWKYCPICGGSAEHKPYKAESEDEE